MLFHEPLRHSLYVLRLVSIEPGGVDQLFQFLTVRVRVGHGVRVALEESGRDLIHPLVRALGGQDPGHEQLERGIPVEAHLQVGVAPGEHGLHLVDPSPADFP